MIEPRSVQASDTPAQALEPGNALGGLRRQVVAEEHSQIQKSGQLSK
jgi:hypothetical protein